MADPGPADVGINLIVGALVYFFFGQIFPENFMEVKEIGPRGGAFLLATAKKVSRFVID